MTLTSPGATGWDVLLRDGAIAHLRPLAIEDEPALQALNSRVSARTRLMRYFSVSDRPGEWYVEHLLEQARLGNAVVAIQGDELVGVASFARLESDPEVADVGLLVDDEHQGTGIGSLLLEHLAHVARHQGIRTFHADVMSENGPMLRMLRASGLSMKSRVERDVTEHTIDLEPSEQARRAVQRREIVSERASLERVLAPRSCAVVGSAREGSVASRVVQSIGSFGYTGDLFVAGRADELPAVDLVVVCVRADRVLDVARAAAAVGAAGLLVLSAGFAETGEQGRDRQDELLGICRRAGMRLIGPNCLGLVNTDPLVRLNATFCETTTSPGRIAVLSQSGAVGIAALRYAERRRTGLSLFVSTGNKADVSGNDLLEYLAADDATSVVAMYLESFGNPRKFQQVAREVGRTKPVVVVKSGRTSVGARAGQSHTAAAATPDVATDALLKAAGALRADDLTELFDLVAVLDAAPLLTGRSIAVIGNSGGPGVLAVDALAAAGLHVAELSSETKQELRRLVPTSASVNNPVDLLATVSPQELGAAVVVLLRDPSVDAVVSVYTPVTAGSEEAVAAALVDAANEVPDVPLLTTFPGIAVPPRGLARAGRPDLPFFEFPEQAARVLAKVAAYGEWRAVPTADDGLVSVRKPQLDQALLSDCSERRWLDPGEVDNVLHALGVSTVETEYVRDRAEALAAADRLGFPVVLKASGPSLVHKSDLGGVITHLRDTEALEHAWEDVSRRLGWLMTGAVVQRHLSADDGLELVVGGYVDESVGPLVMVGLGGVMTDVLADRVLRVPPRTREQARAQLMELRSAAALGGFRGRGALAVDAVADVLVAVGQLLEAYPEVREIDINPLFVTPFDVRALDARIAIQRTDNEAAAPFRTLRPPLSRRSS